MPVWSPAPAFAAGQYASAEGHLNALADNCNQLLAMYHARQTPFTGYAAGKTLEWFEGYLEDDWRRVWSGYIRNKADTLRYVIGYVADVVTGLQIRVQWGDNYTTVLSTASGSGTLNSTIDVSSLTTDTFYLLNIDARANGAPYRNTGSGTVTVLDLYEENPPTYGTLAAFNATNTPTATHWQELSDRATTLYAQVNSPRPPMQGGIATVAGESTVIWSGTFVHLHRYWFYDVRIRPPYEDGTTTVKLYIDGTDYTLGSRETPTDRYPATHTPDEGDTEFDFFTHRGVVDINAQGLTIGTRYTASVQVSGTGDSTIATAKLYGLWQQTPQTPAVAWWETPIVWARGTSVTGASNVKALRNNLEDLSDTTRIVYRNRPTPRRAIPHMAPQWAARYHRYLHYRCEPLSDSAEAEAPSPSLGYWAGDKWEEVSLPYEPNKWLAYDLDGARRLFEGTHYRLLDVTAALEDSSD